MAGRRRGKIERERDRRLIAKYYLEEKSQYEIADLTGLSQSTVQRDLKALEKIWLKASLIDFDAARSKQIAKVVHLALVHWDAWEKSKTSTTIRGASDAENATVTQTEEAGNPAFLAGVERCIKMYIDLKGINAARVLAVVGEDFDQAEWSNQRDARQARAMALLEENDDGEDQ